MSTGKVCRLYNEFVMIYMYIYNYIIVYVYVYFSESAGTEDHSSSTGQRSETGEGVTAQYGGGHRGQLLSLVLLFSVLVCVEWKSSELRG